MLSTKLIAKQGATGIEESVEEATNHTRLRTTDLTQGALFQKQEK